MLGFTPLASAPLADSGVKNVAVIASDITAGVPVLDTATVAVISNFAPQDITAGDPVLDTAPVFEDESFAPQDLLGGEAVLDTLSIAVISNFAPRDLYAGDPVLDPIPFFQDYQLAFDDIFAGQPTLDARLTWDFQELVADSWTDQADDDSVWTTQSASSDTWSEQISFPESGNNFGWTIVEAISNASVGLEPEATLFVNAEAIQGRPLADINNSGSVNYIDTLDMLNYIKGTLPDQSKLDYIRNYMLPYMAARPDDYKIYYNATAESSPPSWTEASESVKVWTNAA